MYNIEIYIRINFKEGNDIEIVFKIILEEGKDVIKVVFLLVKGFFFLLWKIIVSNICCVKVMICKI